MQYHLDRIGRGKNQGSPALKFHFEDASDEALSRWNRDHRPHREKLTP
jgi:hypothetical protein